MSVNQIRTYQDQVEEAILGLTGKVRGPIQGQAPEHVGHLMEGVTDGDLHWITEPMFARKQMGETMTDPLSTIHQQPVSQTHLNLEGTDLWNNKGRQPKDLQQQDKQEDLLSEKILNLNAHTLHREYRHLQQGNLPDQYEGKLMQLRPTDEHHMKKLLQKRKEVPADSDK